MNIKIKWFIHDHYFSVITIVLFILIAVAIYFHIKNIDGKILLPIAGGLISFVYFIQKQLLDEAKFINDLIVKFNQRYGCLNEKLNDIVENRNKLPELDPRERETVNDYFNLCGEEYLFYQRGYVYKEVWRSWVAGMKYYYDNKRINPIWANELKSQSYYGFDINEEIKKLKLSA